jgi:hypothetical protein
MSLRRISAGVVFGAVLLATGCGLCHKSTCRPPAPAPCCPSPNPAVPPPPAPAASGFDGAVVPSPPVGAPYNSGTVR